MFHVKQVRSHARHCRAPSPHPWTSSFRPAVPGSLDLCLGVTRSMGNRPGRSCCRADRAVASSRSPCGRRRRIALAAIDPGMRSSLHQSFHVKRSRLPRLITHEGGPFPLAHKFSGGGEKASLSGRAGAKGGRTLSGQPLGSTRRSRSFGARRVVPERRDVAPIRYPQRRQRGPATTERWSRAGTDPGDHCGPAPVVTDTRHHQAANRPGPAPMTTKQRHRCAPTPGHHQAADQRTAAPMTTKQRHRWAPTPGTTRQRTSGQRHR